MTAISKAVSLLEDEDNNQTGRPHKGYSILAEKLIQMGHTGVTRDLVWKWVNRQHRAPIKYMKAICEATEMRVTVFQLMDDHK